MVNHYEILEISPKANDSEIRNGYITQSVNSSNKLKYHPDRNAEEGATERFQQIAEAYYVLSDKERKEQYDTENDYKILDSVNPLHIFGDMFNDLMIPEVPSPSYFWQPVGNIAGVMLGFIVLNVPGAILGYHYGGKAGKIRDMKGVSVYDAFSKLSYDKRVEILGTLSKQLASKVTSAAIADK